MKRPKSWLRTSSSPNGLKPSSSRRKWIADTLSHAGSASVAKVSDTRPPHYFARNFGGLKVRYKLVVLHNLFFFVLTVAVYLSVIPIFSARIAAAHQREFTLMSKIFAAEISTSLSDADELSIYDLRRGNASTLGLSTAGQQFLREFPKQTWQQGHDTLFRSGKQPGQYRRIQLSSDFYDKALRQARMSLFVVLGSIYLLSIVVLEFLIMPLYVYRPLHLMLAADEAIQHDDRPHELIDDNLILDDEIGQIMRSRNVTILQLRQQEDDLAQALKQLEEQDRLVSLGLLSTSVAHELNTPLAVLQGSIEKLLETNRDGTTLERLGRMLRVTQRLRKISEGLVDFARVRKQETEAVLLRPLIEESWNLVAIDEKAAVIQFEDKVSEEHRVLGNSDRLIQVFVNLLRNALIAVSSNGVITVCSKATVRGGQNIIACSVLDNGPGIPAAILPDLFEAFVTTRLDARGTGLGLTVAEGIVTQHGGTISATNRPEGGAALEVTLPAA